MFTELMAPEKIDEFLNLVSWSPGEPGLFDIQYQSFITLQGNLILPLSIFNSSNFIRNLYASQYKKQNPNLLSDGSHDPVSAALVAVFKEKQIPVADSLKLP